MPASASVLIELGHYAVMLALVFALVQAGAPLLGHLCKRPALGALSVRAAMAQPLLLGLGALALGHAFVTDDFSVAYVAQHSNSALPLVYKITALWGGHEGSLYLWVLILGVYTALLARQGRVHYPQRVAAVLAVQGLLLVGFLGLVLLLSNPFDRLWPAPGEGQDLNPLLQDPGMAAHPPMLYLGYVGFSLPYALVMGALLTRWPAQQWLPFARRWALIAWCFLTTGIVMGGAWAYYELGWGGYWAWDPVENASFMPWLTGTALLHSLMVQEYRRLLPAWNIFLVLTSFALSLIGTFLVRSGVLSSVHAFAVDPGRGAYILGFLTVVLGLSYGLYLWRMSGEARPPRPAGVLSREGLLLANNVLLAVAAAAVLLGTLYPLALDVTLAQKLTVAAPYFNTVVVPMLLVLVLLMGITPTLPWRSADPRRLLRRVGVGLGAGAGAALVLGLAMRDAHLAMTAGCIGAAAVLVVQELLRGARRPGRAGLLGDRRRSGALLTHLGVVVVALGLGASGLLRSTVSVELAPGDQITLAGHVLEFRGVREAAGPNYSALRAEFALDGGRTLLHPERRVYAASRMPTTEAAIDSRWLRDVYVVVGEARAGRYPVTAYVNPLVQWIWYGTGLMVLGGLLAMGTRRRELAPQAPETLPVPALPVI